MLFSVLATTRRTYLIRLKKCRLGLAVERPKTDLELLAEAGAVGNLNGLFSLDDEMCRRDRFDETPIRPKRFLTNFILV
jgi:hypothetical protein